jgi:hypothetical protein
MPQPPMVNNPNTVVEARMGTNPMFDDTKENCGNI